MKDFTTRIPLPYKLFLCLSGILILVSFLFNSPHQIFIGLRNIILNPDILITDYMEIGGVGATFINCALLIIFYVIMLIFLNVKPSGTIIAGVFTVSGFSLFGKNILNIWPIIFGIWLYSRFQKEPFSNYIVTALFGTTLSPALIQLIGTTTIPLYLSVMIGILISIVIGFLLPPLASACMRIHQGYSLYNVGLAAGLIGTVLMSLLRAFGIDFESRIIWSTGNNVPFIILFSMIFLAMITLGFYYNGNSFKNITKITRYSGRLLTDFYLIFGEGITLINMGILGLFSMFLVVLVNGDLNGPTLGGILTIVGFGAFGKHLKNIIPIMFGIILCTFFNIWEINSPSVILSLLFGTTLAPIAGSFGWLWGIIAGVLHACLVMNITYLHGGMILYNNGFSGGLVCMFLLPLISAFRKEY
ncbi:membrane protein [Clostridium sulfidigenes]|uniref:Membrane protein n=1 Tax=Clostridium sulfidigenes TaxID=318464 RepID=A0A084J821_9CLOT|nr:membrane protein [Clostridium sulfidigenes]